LIRTALIYDVHCPYHDKEAYELAIDYLTKLKPRVDQVVLGGDFVDFYAISFWKNTPRLPFEDEIMECRQELKNLKQRFYRRPFIYLEGNHEQRLHRYCLEKAPDLAYRNGIQDLLGLKKRRIDYISNIERMCAGDSPFKLGRLYVLHGHEKKVSFGAVNLARLYYLRSKVNVIAGHHHKSDYALHKKLDGTHEGAWTVGTLGKLAEPYMPINEWNWGFAYVDHDPTTGMFEVHNKIILEGRIVNG
jgi:predicted phosphodiesterase